MTDILAELQRLGRQHADGDLDTEQWITATEALTQENP